MAYVAAFEGASTRNLIGAQGSERVIGPEVSASFFRVFGVRPLLGRVFAEEEDDPGHAQTTVISHAFWQRYFNGDPQVLGKPVTLDSYRRRTYAVIGVMPAGFDMPNRTDLWLPMGESEVRPNGHDEHGICGPRSQPGLLRSVDAAPRLDGQRAGGERQCRGADDGPGCLASFVRRAGHA